MNKSILMLLPLFLFFLSNCGEDPVEEMNIVELAQGNSDLSILVDAVVAANLDGTLSGTGPFTVFAPTNEAFQALLDSDPTWNTLADIPAATLESVLLFHVLSGKVEAADLASGYVSTLSTGPNDEPISLQVDLSNGVAFNGGTSPVTTDVQASNGVVHIVDAVMLPPALPNLALNNSAFSMLVGALVDTRHTTDFVGTLSGAGPFTVFAPTNAAFQALLDSDPAWTTTADIPIATLDAVLKYHVIANANVQADQLSNGAVTTFQGSDITVDLTNGAQIITGSSQTVNVVITDVQGSNGVVHAIDAVMLP